MKRNLWLFLVKLATVSLGLGYLWYSGWQRSYPDLIDPIATPVLTLLGVRRWWLALVVEHFTNIIPFVALVVATPGIVRGWKRTLIALVIGLGVLLIGHLLMSAAVYHLQLKYSLSRSFYKVIVPVYIINDAMPLVLWLVFFPEALTDLFGLVRRDRSGTVLSSGNDTDER